MGSSCKVVFKFMMCVTFCAGALHVFAWDSLRTESRNGATFVVHVVEQGETLYSLSKRYGATIESISRENDIVNNNLAVGQQLMVPFNTVFERTSSAVYDTKTKDLYHIVKQGETLYSLSRKYGVTVDRLRDWNDLSSNEIAVDQELIVSREGGLSVNERPVAKEKKKNRPVKNEKPSVIETGRRENRGNIEKSASKEFVEYQVQSGETLEGIAKKFEVKPDSIVIWNGLVSGYLAIGQKLRIKGEPKVYSKPENIKKTAYGTIRKQTSSSGFTKVFEEGIASKIASSVETKKYLALHRTLPIGSLIEVRNLMNNQKVFVRVVGYLPDTGLNENILIRLSPICFERLGVIDPKVRVEVSYYQD